MDRRAGRRVRIPQQRRSIEIKEKIKAAAQVLFSEKGYHQTSSNDIVKAAGVSIGAFYAYFTDKKALFIEILREYNRTVVSQLPLGLLEEEGLRERVELYIRAVLQAHSYSAAFHREILAMCYADAEIKAIVDEYEEAMISRIALLIEKNRELSRISDIPAAAYLIFKCVEEVVHGIRVFSRPCDEAAMLRELSDMILSYALKR